MCAGYNHNPFVFVAGMRLAAAFSQKDFSVSKGLALLRGLVFLTVRQLAGDFYEA